MGKSSIAGLLLLGLSALTVALTPTTFLNKDDKSRLKGLFISAQPYADLSSAHYSIYGLQLLGEPVPKPQDACNFIKSKASASSLESLYHAVAASVYLGNCPLTISGAQQTFEAALKEDSSVVDLFYGVSGLKHLKKPVDSVKVGKVLTTALKKDDSILNLGHAFFIASQLTGDLTQFFERIEDAVVQADEVDGKFLQFEGGLSITATIVSGVFKLAEAAKKAPALTGDQTVKFTNYFLSRKFVQTLKGGSQLLDVLHILTTNKYHIPVAVTLASNAAISPKNPVVQVQVTNVLGAALGPLNVIADSCSRLEDGKALLSKKSFISVQGDYSLYTLNLMENKPIRGFYKLSITAATAKADPRMVGSTGAVVHVKVMTDVGVDNLELDIVDRDQATAAKTIKIEFNQKLKTLLEADHHQKLLLRFTLKDKNAGVPMTAHQVFVQLVHSATKQEIVFVAEPDTSGSYKFDMDLLSKAKDFQYQSGKYSISLIVGDAIIANPFIWNLVDIDLSLPQNPSSAKPRENPYTHKPEIKHLFREQEKRPSTVVSNTFSALVLLPLLILFILWGKIGVNVSNFPFSPSAIGFHLSLAGILGLLTCFWLQLNMFTTLKYLAVLGVAIFISGHGLLSQMAAAKK